MTAEIIAARGVIGERFARALDGRPHLARSAHDEMDRLDHLQGERVAGMAIERGLQTGRRSGRVAREPMTERVHEGAFPRGRGRAA